MKKSYIAAALVAVAAAAGFAVTANASWFHSAPQVNLPKPLTSLADFYDGEQNYTTTSYKASIYNPVAYDPSASLAGLRIGDSLVNQAPACDPNAPRQVVGSPADICTVPQSLTRGVIVKGLPDGLEAYLAFGHGIVGTDSNGRINAVLLPMHRSDVLARISLQGLVRRFGAPTSIGAGEAVWNLPNDVQVKLVYDDERNVLGASSTTSGGKALYAAIYTKDAVPTLHALLTEGWKAEVKSGD